MEKPIICRKEVFDNIRRVREGEPLTKPLKQLNRFCEFRKEWENQFNLVHEEELKKEEEIKKEEVKKRMKEYNQKPEVKKRMKEYKQRPEVKKRMREYNQRPEVKKRMREYWKEYYQKNKDKWKNAKNR